MCGINTWFIIEILSFYGYIFSAIIFIIEMQIQSSLGNIKKEDVKNKKFKHDFLSYHKKEIDWFAFITILFFVNTLLILIDKIFIKKH